MPRMKDIAIDCFLSVRTKMNPNKRKHCFELFGFDFLLDEDFRVWLIEINTNPYLGTPSAAMRKLVPKMINEAFKIVVDPHFAPAYCPTGDKNSFELIYREQAPVVNHRRPFSLNLCYPIPRLKPFFGRPERKLHKHRVH